MLLTHAAGNRRRSSFQRSSARSTDWIKTPESRKMRNDPVILEAKIFAEANHAIRRSDSSPPFQNQYKRASCENTY